MFSGSTYRAIISSDKPNKRPASENGPIQPAKTGLSFTRSAVRRFAFRYSGTRAVSRDGICKLSIDSLSDTSGSVTLGTSSSGKTTFAPKASASTVRSIITVGAAEGYCSFNRQIASACTIPLVTASLTVFPQSSMPGWVMIGIALRSFCLIVSCNHSCISIISSFFFVYNRFPVHNTGNRIFSHQPPDRCRLFR